MNNIRKNNDLAISDDYELFDRMIKESSKLKKDYQPGSYWLGKTKSAVNEIKKYGLNEFRGMKSGLANSYSDNAYIDIRTNHNYGVKSIFINNLKYFYPIKKLFDAQVKLTKNYFDKLNNISNEFFKNNERVIELLSKYEFNFETTKGGCLSYGNFNGNNISHYYLKSLDILDHINNQCDIASKKTFFEIGGGFGVSTHMIIEFFKVKKIIYLDIIPNLYVGTQYLKSFYGKNVIDFKECIDKDSIKFKHTDELEIFCISPDQIDKVDSKIDFFHNAHSFVEMPEKIIRNYANKIESKLSKTNSTISLISYSHFDSRTTINPEKLPNFFSRKAKKSLVPTLIPNQFNYHFIM